MKNVLKKVVALLMTAWLLAGAVCPAMAGGITIKKHPKDVTVNAGGKAEFTAAAEGYTGITWRLVSPNGQKEILVKDVGETFPGVTYSGRNANTLTLFNIPETMHGWSVYCTYSDGSNKVKTKAAYVWINGYDPNAAAVIGGYDGAANDTENDALRYAQDAQGSKRVTVVGATLTADGVSGNQIDFSGKSQVNFKVTASATPAYWVINGARYDFDIVPNVITVKELTYSMTIEAVMKGAAPQTLLNDNDLQAKRTGEKLIATSQNADLCFITASGQGKGGWFRELDFTDNFVNLATGQEELGGRVTLNCRAYVASGKKIAYWEFNKAKLTFSSNMTEFIVSGLNETMEYHPVTVELEPTEVPPAYYTVTCEGCTFSGGGYTNATSGKVLAGTKVTFTAGWSYVDRWYVNGSVPTRKEKVKVDEGYWDSKTEKWVSVWVEKEMTVSVQDKSITRTIKKDTHVVCNSQIN